MPLPNLTAISAIATILLLSSCNSHSSSKIDTDTLVDTSKVRITERQIDTSDFYISLPNDFTIETKDGPDFSVYYISPVDTNKSKDFYGGLYFGNFSGKFSADYDTCKRTEIKGKILDSIAVWKIFNCNGIHSLETIVESKSGLGWNQYIRAFGHARSEIELKKLFDIFLTLKRHKK